MTRRRRKALTPLIIISCLAAWGCDAESQLRFFHTTSPDLGYLTTYTGRLAKRDGCIVLVLGERMLSRSDIVREGDAVAIPLFNRRYSIEEDKNGFTIVTPDGRFIPEGAVITGEGGPYPAQPLNPRSAPVEAPPDTSMCEGIPYQINSIFVSDLIRTG